MGVTSATITTTTADAFIPEEWAKYTSDAVEFAMCVQKRVRRKEEDVLKVGDVVRVAHVSNLTLQTKSSGLANVISWEALTQNQFSLTVSTVQYAAFLVEDVAQAQIPQDMAGVYGPKIGYALSRGREVTMFNHSDALDTNTVIGTDNVPLSFDDYLTGHQNLLLSGVMKDSVSADEDCSLFLSAQEWVNALRIDQLINRNYNPEGNAIQSAKIGKLLSYPVYVSLLTQAGTAGHEFMMMHRDAMTLVVQKVVSLRSSFIIENIGTGYVGWNLYGGSVFTYAAETGGSVTAVNNRGQRLRGQ